MFTHKAYFIETLTNTHVGSGDTTFGIADLVIQKDPTTSLPVFHPSSVKGAVKDHFESCLGDNEQEKGSDRVKKSTFDAIFGASEAQNYDDLKKDEVAESEVELIKRAPRHGLLKFYEARLLTLPLRSSLRVYHNGTSPAAVLDYLDALEGFRIVRDGKEPSDIGKIRGFFQDISGIFDRNPGVEFLLTAPFSEKPMIEEYENGEFHEPEGDLPELLARYLSPRPSADFPASLAVFRDNIFQEICDSGLPIIARNSLDEKGISQNLFYEEVLPRRSVLWFMTGAYHLFSRDEAPAFRTMFRFFEKKLETDPIQMGANASIGYGMTRLIPIDGERKGGAE
jgi:CRISPR-associated protein Cmr4